MTQSYLRERCQIVLTAIVNAYDSVSYRWKKVTNGVPQGLILGPFFFLILQVNAVLHGLHHVRPSPILLAVTVPVAFSRGRAGSVARDVAPRLH